ncbi:MAG: CYTH domain-containing protein, partial [Myxococcota bacterium]|nr:CYTH domain-containing protein [Myxococcota bacterium]
MRPRLLLPMLLALALAPAAGADPHATGMRVESEIKLSFPSEQADALFAHATERLGDGDLLAGYGPLRVEHSEELFPDGYFDTPGWAALEGGHGVRHRTREIPGQPAHRKAGRQLVQIKTAAPGDDGSGVRRAEYKFEVAPVREARSAWDRHPLLGLVRSQERVPLHEQLTALGLEPEALAPVLTLEQRRRRVYVSDPDGPLATLTVDEVSARKLLWEVRFGEVEVEMNEIRFTAAPETERARMERFADALRAKLGGRFPELRVDQTPKYEKAVAALEAQVPGFRRFGALHVTRNQALVAALVGAVAAFAWIERRRQRRARHARGRVGERSIPTPAGGGPQSAATSSAPGAGTQAGGGASSGTTQRTSCRRTRAASS